MMSSDGCSVRQSMNSANTSPVASTSTFSFCRVASP